MKARAIAMIVGSIVAGVSVSTAAAQTSRVQVPPVPANLEVPAGQEPYLSGYAIGTQNYICLATAAGMRWQFLGPQATLFDDASDQVLTHYLSANPSEGGTARPTWQHSRDSGAVWAQPVASSSDPDFVAPGAIPWLLLRVVGAEDGPTGGDRVTETTFIQRVNTSGGVTPAGDCPTVGAKLFVPYTADYVFYRARR